MASTPSFPSFKIQAIAPTDLDPVLALDQAALGGLWNRDGYQREIDSENSSLLGLWSYDANRLLGLGCVWRILDEAHITTIAIDPQHHRQGFGQLLLWVLLKDSHQRGMKRATLEVNCNNTGAIALYEKFGFKQLGIRKNYYGKGYDAAILWLNRLDWPQFTNTLDTWEHEIANRLAPQMWHWDDVV